MKRLVIGAIISTILVIVAFSMASSSMGYSLRVNAYSIERVGDGVVFNYKFVVYGWKDAQASVEFTNPLNESGNVTLTVAGIHNNIMVGSHDSVILGTFVLANDGPLYFDVTVSYKRPLDIGEVAAVASNSLSVYSSGYISLRGLSYFAFVEAFFAGMVVLVLFLLGRYGEVFELYNSWIIIFLLWVLLDYRVGINGPLIFDLSMKYPFAYYNIISSILEYGLLVKVLAVFTGVLSFYYSSESRVDVFEHLIGVYDKGFLIFRSFINPLLVSLLLIGLAIGLVIAGGGFTLGKDIGYWEALSAPLAVISYIILVYLFMYLISGGVSFVTRRPMLSIVVSILIALFINYPIPFNFSSKDGVELNDFAIKFLLKGLISVIVGLLLIIIGWLKR